MDLPGCDELYLRFFDPLVSEGDRESRGFEATFPDVLQHESFIGATQQSVSVVPPEGQEMVLKQMAGMVEAVRIDFPQYLEVTGDISLKWIDAFDEYYDRETILEILNESDPAEDGNNYVVLCCEFGAALGYVLQSAEPSMVWRLSSPYWDSCLVHPKTGTALSVFHWAIKKMSDYGVDDGFEAKVMAALNFVREGRRLSDGA